MQTIHQHWRHRTFHRTFIWLVVPSIWRYVVFSLQHLTTKIIRLDRMDGIFTEHGWPICWALIRHVTQQLTPLWCKPSTTTHRNDAFDCRWVPPLEVWASVSHGLDRDSSSHSWRLRGKRVLCCWKQHESLHGGGIISFSGASSMLARLLVLSIWKLYCIFCNTCMETHNSFLVFWATASIFGCETSQPRYNTSCKLKGSTSCLVFASFCSAKNMEDINKLAPWV